MAEHTQAFAPVSSSTSALREDNFPNFVVEEGSIEGEEEEEDDVTAEVRLTHKHIDLM